MIECVYQRSADAQRCVNTYRVPTRSGNSGSQGRVREFGSLAKVREKSGNPKIGGGDILSEHFFVKVMKQRHV